MENLYLIIGRSGSGKTSLVKKLERIYHYKSVESYTTRPPRYVGEDGHTFISKEEFDKKEMIAYTKFDNYEYGVDKELLDNAKLYVIDIAGAKLLKENYKDKNVVTVYLNCSRQKLINNMIARGDDPIQIKKRLENDDKMFAEESTYPFDYIINRTDLLRDFDIIGRLIFSNDFLTNLKETKYEQQF